MFMIVSYPWPIASAHVELSGRQRAAVATQHPGATEDSICHRARHVEDLLSWTGTGPAPVPAVSATPGR
jgi:hypothetical protein